MFPTCVVSVSVTRKYLQEGAAGGTDMTVVIATVLSCPFLQKKRRGRKLYWGRAYFDLHRILLCPLCWDLAQTEGDQSWVLTQGVLQGACLNFTFVDLFLMQPCHGLCYQPPSRAHRPRDFKEKITVWESFSCLLLWAACCHAILSDTQGKKGKTVQISLGILILVTWHSDICRERLCNGCSLLLWGTFN